jgi:adenylosuccinate synthase
VAARFSTQLNGFSGAILTRLDILDTFASIKICTGYEVDGDKLNYFPSSAMVLEKCQPIYEELPGWQSSIDHLRHFDQLPPQAQSYVKRVEELIGCPIVLISVGPRREQAIQLRTLW